MSVPVSIQSRRDQKVREERTWLILEDDQNRVWRFEREFLRSPWKCVFGAGCRGIHPSQDAARMDGCCTYGAHFAEAEDYIKVMQFVPNVPKHLWQQHAHAQRVGWFKRLPDGRIATRTTKGRCIFSNQPGFAGGAGCALHLAALSLGRRPIDVKPDVCWELPIRTEDSETDDGRRTITVRRWDRMDFGPEGAEMNWWCTEEATAPEAFTADTPVYESLAAELTELCGPQIYARIVKELSAQ